MERYKGRLHRSMQLKDKDHRQYLKQLEDLKNQEQAELASRRRRKQENGQFLLKQIEARQ